MPNPEADAARRNLLRWLAASPLAVGPLAASLPALSQTPAAPRLITSAAQALNVFELEAVARQTIPPAHFGYLSGGVLDDRTVAANRKAYDRWGLRARRLVDVSRVDLSTSLFSQTLASPVALAPVSSQKAFHVDGELVAAKAAGGRKALQILSTLTTVPVEDVIAAHGGPVWFQLYPTSSPDIRRHLVARADAAGASAIVLTIDLLAGGMRRETEALGARIDTRTCTTCHTPRVGYDFSRKRMFDGLDMAGVFSPLDATLTWDVIARLRDMTSKRILVKGIMTAEDAEIAIARGVDGIIVSNHGGRSEESLIGTLDVLPGIVAAVRKRIPVLIDGGVRRGVDAFKALALGADAVCIGRPYVWGLGAFGEAGAAAALALIDAELRAAMQQAGVTRIADISVRNLAILE